MLCGDDPRLVALFAGYKAPFSPNFWPTPVLESSRDFKGAVVGGLVSILGVDERFGRGSFSDRQRAMMIG